MTPWLNRRNALGRSLWAAALAGLPLAGAASAQPARPSPSWELGFDAQETYETNIQYRRIGGGGADAAGMAASAFVQGM